MCTNSSEGPHALRTQCNIKLARVSSSLIVNSSNVSSSQFSLLSSLLSAGPGREARLVALSVLVLILNHHPNHAPLCTSKKTCRARPSDISLVVLACLSIRTRFVSKNRRMSQVEGPLILAKRLLLRMKRGPADIILKVRSWDSRLWSCQSIKKREKEEEEGKIKRPKKGGKEKGSQFYLFDSGT